MKNYKVILIIQWFLLIFCRLVITMKEKEVEVFYPESPAKWRKWLTENHLTSQSVWLVGYNKKSGKKSITWAESVEVWHGLFYAPAGI